MAVKKCISQGKRRRYFEGWYFKQQNNQESLALIPAFHINKAGEASASLQVIENNQAWHIPFPVQDFQADRKQLLIRLGACSFSPQGCKLQAEGPDCQLEGSLYFGPFAPLAYDIMGPFCYMPGMECRHSVFSMSHRVEGRLLVNGKAFVFKNDHGYMEGDRGKSFPKRYLWTQYSWMRNSLMLSVAEIPLGPFSFTGCTGFILLKGKEYRIATYLGARLLHISEDTMVIRQGKLRLQIKRMEEKAQPLLAPDRGAMARTIYESLCCPVQYTCTLKGEILFDFTARQASFESNWQPAAEDAQTKEAEFLREPLF